jgi:hypothetical protein
MDSYKLSEYTNMHLILSKPLGDGAVAVKVVCGKVTSM